MAVDIFGQSADMREIMDIAKKYDLKVISDTAQAPGALYDKVPGTLLTLEVTVLTIINIFIQVREVY